MEFILDFTPSAALIEQLTKEGVDMSAMRRFLADLNGGKFKDVVPEKIIGVPSIDHPHIINRASLSVFKADVKTVCEKFHTLRLPFSPESVCLEEADGFYVFDKPGLERIGVALYPRTAFGILNGGSASSYVDAKKNKELCPAIFDFVQGRFGESAAAYRGKPKGVTAAYFNPDGSPGYSFLLLKLRMILECKRRFFREFGRLPEVVLPSFQMTSVRTDAEIARALDAYTASLELLAVAKEAGCPAVEMHTETQAMMAALTHSSCGTPRRIFDRAYGKPDTGLAFPGGHGQNFAILAPVYKKLYDSGVRYVWLGNIDNLGYTVDPVSLAVFALSGRDAAFETSFRTPMDVKGGLIVATESGKLTCADIGPAVSPEEMRRFESGGAKLLFNCAIGLFDLEKLIPMLDTIPYKLPLRITDQDKDAGRYAQAEQLTWEIIGLLDNPLFFAVKKTQRFIASKMILENLLTSLPDFFFRDSGLRDEPLYRLSKDLHEGLRALLEGEYGMVLEGGRWRFK